MNVPTKTPRVAKAKRTKNKPEEYVTSGVMRDTPEVTYKTIAPKQKAQKKVYMSPDLCPHCNLSRTWYSYHVYDPHSHICDIGENLMYDCDYDY